MKVVYHDADYDGIACAAILHQYLFNQDIDPHLEMMGMDYGDEFDWDKIRKGERVYMVDFSLQPFSKMEKLHSMCDLTWIDHHASAISDEEQSNVAIPGVREEGTAACVLLYQHLYPGKTIPEPLELIGAYDVWNDDDPRWKERILPFQYGLRAMVPRGKADEPTYASTIMTTIEGSPPWQHHGLIQDVVQAGKAVIRYQTKTSAQVAGAQAFRTTIDGHNAVAINGTAADNSSLFDAAPDAPVMINFYKTKEVNAWTVELFSEDGVDVGNIAHDRGGGGHASAAGYQTDHLPEFCESMSFREWD